MQEKALGSVILAMLVVAGTAAAVTGVIVTDQGELAALFDDSPQSSSPSGQPVDDPDLVIDPTTGAVTAAGDTDGLADGATPAEDGTTQAGRGQPWTRPGRLPRQHEDFPPNTDGTGPAIPDPGNPEPPILQTDIACNGQLTAGKLLSNHGQGDANMTDLTWGALRGGFRFAVSWTSKEETTARLHYDLFSDLAPGAAGVTITDDKKLNAHLFVTPGRLPLGNWMRFYVEELDESGAVVRTSEKHEVVLCNAMNAFSLVHQKYFANVLVSIRDDCASYEGIEAPNEADCNTVDHEAAELGMTVFAKKIHDATEGYVAIGTVFMVYNEDKFIQSGTWTPDAPEPLPPTPDIPPVCPSGFCPQDVYWSYHQDYQAAATAQLGAIRRDGGFIIMNQAYEGFSTPGDGSGNSPQVFEIGSVLAHEFGHYAFSMMDMYNPPDCYLGSGDEIISIMGSNRMATEFDDAHLNRCPNEAAMTSPYFPAWNSLIMNFPLIPDRAGEINPGPANPGPAYFMGVIDRKDYTPEE